MRGFLGSLSVALQGQHGHATMSMRASRGARVQQRLCGRLLVAAVHEQRAHHLVAPETHAAQALELAHRVHCDWAAVGQCGQAGGAGGAALSQKKIRPPGAPAASAPARLPSSCLPTPPTNLVRAVLLLRPHNGQPHGHLIAGVSHACVPLEQGLVRVVPRLGGTWGPWGRGGGACMHGGACGVQQQRAQETRGYSLQQPRPSY